MNKKLVPVLLLGLLVAGVIAVMMIGKDEEKKPLRHRQRLASSI